MIKYMYSKIIAAMIMIAIIAAYPLTCNSESKNAKKITLTSSNMVTLFGEINTQSVAQTIQSLRALDSNSVLTKNKPIYLFLYSPGGDIQAGLELIEAVHGMNRPVDTITLFAASMAFQISQNLNHRYILKNGISMSHRAAGGFMGSFGGKSPSQMDSRYGFWLQRLNELDQETVRRTNGKQTMDSYREQYRDELWLTGTQAVDQGYADDLANVHCNSSLDGTVAHVVQFMGVTLSYETAKCPVITSILNVKITAPDGKVITESTSEEIKNKFVDQFDFEKNIK